MTLPPEGPGELGWPVTALHGSCCVLLWERLLAGGEGSLPPRPWGRATSVQLCRPWGSSCWAPGPSISAVVSSGLSLVSGPQAVTRAPLSLSPSRVGQHRPGDHAPWSVHSSHRARGDLEGTPGPQAGTPMAWPGGAGHLLHEELQHLPSGLRPLGQGRSPRARRSPAVSPVPPAESPGSLSSPELDVISPR